MRWGLRFGDADLIVQDATGHMFEVVIHWDEGETVIWHRPEIDELVWL